MKLVTYSNRPVVCCMMDKQCIKKGWWLQTTPDDFGRLQTTSDDLGRIQITTDDSDSRWLQTALDGSRRLQTTPDDSRWLQTTPDDSKRFRTTLDNAGRTYLPGSVPKFLVSARYRLRMFANFSYHLQELLMNAFESKLHWHRSIIIY